MLPFLFPSLFMSVYFVCRNFYSFPSILSILSASHFPPTLNFYWFCSKFVTLSWVQLGWSCFSQEDGRGSSQDNWHNLAKRIWDTIRHHTQYITERAAWGRESLLTSGLGICRWWIPCIVYSSLVYSFTVISSFAALLNFLSEHLSFTFFFLWFFSPSHQCCGEEWVSDHLVPSYWLCLSQNTPTFPLSQCIFALLLPLSSKVESTSFPSKLMNERTNIGERTYATFH